jgi:glycosyltransferase involved in cell wall biosynthesis
LEGTPERRQESASRHCGRLPEDDSPFAPDPRPVAARLDISDRVHFIGWVDEADKPALYSLALASIYLSEYEGFGLPLLEAMGSGCAVLAGGQPIVQLGPK